MATAANIISAAFQKVGVQSPSTTQNTAALTSLNNMISFLGADRLTYSVTSESFSVTASDPEYTIGSGGNWDTTRPIAVLSCFLRDSDNLDHPVKPMSSKEYNQIYDKALIARPKRFYFRTEYTLAKINFDYYPDSDYDAYFEFLKNFTEFSASSDTVALPPEYKEALVYNLAISLGEDWDRKVPETVIFRARETREIIDRINASNRPVPLAVFDFYGLESSGRPIGSDYSILSDELIDGGAF